MQTESAYADAANLYDVELEREVLPEGTPVRLQFTGAELEDAESKAPYVVLSFECVNAENAGHAFTVRKYLHLWPSNPKKPKNTAFKSSLRDLVSMAAGIFETEDEAREFFRNGPGWNGNNQVEVYGHVLERLNSLVSSEFDTSLSVDFDGDVVRDEETGAVSYNKSYNPDGSPKMNEKTKKQCGTYPAKQTVGRVKWLYKNGAAE